MEHPFKVTGLLFDWVSNVFFKLNIIKPDEDLGAAPL